MKKGTNEKMEIVVKAVKEAIVVYTVTYATLTVLSKVVPKALDVSGKVGSKVKSMLKLTACKVKEAATKSRESYTIDLTEKYFEENQELDYSNDEE